MDLKANRDKVWKLLSPQDREKWERDAFDMKLIDRSGWAYRELSALLELKNTHGLEPGIAQRVRNGRNRLAAVSAQQPLKVWR